MIHKIPKSYDSKFRFVLVAAERAKQIQNGAPPKIDVKSRKPAFVAIQEAIRDLINYEILEEEEEEKEGQEAQG